MCVSECGRVWLNFARSMFCRAQQQQRTTDRPNARTHARTHAHTHARARARKLALASARARTHAQHVEGRHRRCKVDRRKDAREIVQVLHWVHGQTCVRGRRHARERAREPVITRYKHRKGVLPSRASWRVVHDTKRARRRRRRQRQQRGRQRTTTHKRELTNRSILQRPRSGGAASERSGKETVRVRSGGRRRNGSCATTGWRTCTLRTPAHPWHPTRTPRRRTRICITHKRAAAEAAPQPTPRPNAIKPKN